VSIPPSPPCSLDFPLSVELSDDFPTLPPKTPLARTLNRSRFSEACGMGSKWAEFL
jgi:hypothetical protein